MRAARYGVANNPQPGQEHTPKNLRENPPFFDTPPRAPGEEKPVLTSTYGVVVRRNEKLGR
jgi:hypothetical protein